MKLTAFAVIAMGVSSAILAFLCLFVQKRFLEYFLQVNIRQLDFLRSHSWFLAVVGGLVVVFGLGRIIKRGSYAGPFWFSCIMVLVGIAIVLGHKFIAYYQYDLYYNLYLQRTDGVISWQPAVQWHTYAAGVVSSLLAPISVSTGIYNLRH